MIKCDKCDRFNDETARICRYCGTVLGSRPLSTGVRDYAPPSAPSAQSAPFDSKPQGVEPYSPPGLASGYKCPNCGSNYPPLAEKKISMEGWIVFAALLVFCLPLFWIGLLMKEEQRVCPACRHRLA